MDVDVVGVNARVPDDDGQDDLSSYPIVAIGIESDKRDRVVVLSLCISRKADRVSDLRDAGRLVFFVPDQPSVLPTSELLDGNLTGTEGGDDLELWLKCVDKVNISYGPVLRLNSGHDNLRVQTRVQESDRDGEGLFDVGRDGYFKCVSVRAGQDLA